MTEPARILEALRFIPAHDRDTWLRMGMAIKSELDDSGYELWDQWGQQAESHREKDAKAVWRSIKPNGRVTVGTLFHEAKQHGYRPENGHSRPNLADMELDRRQRELRAKLAAEQDSQRREQTKAQAAEIWSRCAPLDTHPYLTSKGVKSYGLRLYHGPLVINGMRCDGSVVIPLRDQADELRSLEFINESGDKRFLPNGPKTGHYFSIGKPADRVLIAEGYATAASLHEATGVAVAVAFDAGNLEPVAKAVRGKLPDARIIMCADNDTETEGNPGLTKALNAAQAVGGTVAIPELNGARCDFNDLHQVQGAKVVRVVIEGAQPVTAAAEGKSAADCQRTADAETIARLGALPALEYDRIRLAEAEKLGVRVQTLDEQVKRAHGSGGHDQGNLMFAQVIPWPDPVNGKHLLDSLAASCKRFIILPAHCDTALALWVLFTYLIESAEVAPILALLSPEKRCGKTTCVDWLSRLVRRPMPASNISPAALFRAVEAWGPTLLIDEADSFAKENEELRGILNSGHTRTTAFVVRTVGDDHEPKPFSTWGAKLIALIGKLPDTLQDRAITVELRRKLSSERVEKLRHTEPGAFETLARQCVRFAEDNAAAIRAARPAIPDELNDRAADNWEPLLAIADVAGGAWPRLAREAASVLSGASPDGDSTKTELLQDVHAALKGRFEERDRVGSAELIEALTADPEARWCEFNRGKPLTQRQLARLLRPFGITSGSVRLEGGTAKGYRVEGFADAFSRYIPLFDPAHRHNPILARVSGENASGTASALLRIADPAPPRPGVVCAGVTDENPPSGGKEEFEAF